MESVGSSILDFSMRGAGDIRACLLMRMLGRLEFKGGWNHAANHIAGVCNTLAAGISRCPRVIQPEKVRELTNSDDWSEQGIGMSGKAISIPYFRQRT